jgi:hypothetical protein
MPFWRRCWACPLGGRCSAARHGTAVARAGPSQTWRRGQGRTHRQAPLLMWCEASRTLIHRVADADVLPPTLRMLSVQSATPAAPAGARARAVPAERRARLVEAGHEDLRLGVADLHLRAAQQPRAHGQRLEPAPRARAAAGHPKVEVRVTPTARARLARPPQAPPCPLTRSHQPAVGARIGNASRRCMQAGFEPLSKPVRHVGKPCAAASAWHPQEQNGVPH